MLKTRFTEEWGIKYPIIAGGMMWVSRAEFIAAVANAGALGFLTALTQPTPEDLVKEVERTRELTDQPFGVNLTILPTLKPVSYEAYVEAIVASGVKFVETAGRNPQPYLPAFKKAGIKVIHKCTSVRHCVKAEAVGCDAVSIDGFECAGHPGEDDIPGLILIPVTADKVSICKIASGGLGDARGMVAALALGADGINMGTRFMATQESKVHDNVKQAMIDNDERSTNLIYRKLRNTARVAKNSISDQVVEMEAKGDTTIEDLAPLISGKRGKNVLETGDMEAGIWSGGMIQGLIHDIPTCEELVTRICEGAEEIIANRLEAMTAVSA